MGHFVKALVLGTILSIGSFMLIPHSAGGIGCLLNGGGPGGPGGSPNNDGGDGQCGESGSGGGGGGGGGSAAGGNGSNGAGGGILLKSTSGVVTISGTIDATGGNSSTVNGGTLKIFSTCGIDTSGVTAGRIYDANNCVPAAPSLIYPLSDSNGNSVFTTFKLRASDSESDYLEYWIDVCADNTCNTIIRSICQTNTGNNVPGVCTPSQIGWGGQNQQGGIAYTGQSVLNLSSIATLNYQPPLLTANTTYWWRAYAIDPGGSNTWSSASPIQSFVTAPTETHIQGNVMIKGGVNL